MQVPTDFFTLSSLLTFSGATVAAWLVPYAFFVLIGEKFRPYMKWVAFVVALALMGLAAYISVETGWIKYVVAIVNGIVIFLAAVGANTMAANATMRVDDTPIEPGTMRGEGEQDVSISDGQHMLYATEGAFKYWF